MKLLLTPILFLAACSAFQVKPTAEAQEPAAQAPKEVKTEPRVIRAQKSQNKGILKKLVGFATNYQKPTKGFSSKKDPAKVFTYTSKFRASAREGVVNFEIKPEGDKFRFTCKIVIETPSQEETLDFTSLDAAEIIRQLKIVLGDDGYDSSSD